MERDHELEWRRLLLYAAIFGVLFFLPVGEPRFHQSVDEALHLARDYAREHVVLCLLPAFWIAGAIGAFVSQASVLRYLGPKSNPVLAHGVASVSGTILAVCSCTVLPLFAGITPAAACSRTARSPVCSCSVRSARRRCRRRCNSGCRR